MLKRRYGIMGILSRFTDIMKANVNSVLEKAEDKNADKLLRKYIQDAKDDLANARSETAAVIAEEMSCARRLADCDEQIEKYERYAMAAVKAGNDSDARKFLTYKSEASTKREGIARDYESAKQNSEKMRQMTAKLAEDIRDAEQKMAELDAKLSLAKAQEKRSQLAGQMGDGLDGFDSLLDKVQKRIDAADAALSLQDADREKKDLEEKYACENFKSSSVDDELARLKRMMNGEE